MMTPPTDTVGPDVRLYRGDAMAVLAGMDDASVDAVVTDPPAGIGFMGKEWDGDRGGRVRWIEWLSGILAECYRVAKPGARLLCWSLPRTNHWTGTAVEDAGWVVEDVIAHLFGSGFPKHASKLKPAREDWWLARKPGGKVPPLGIDECRVPAPDGVPIFDRFRLGNGIEPGAINPSRRTGDTSSLGRWPANVTHDGSDVILAGFPETESGKVEPHHMRRAESQKQYGGFGGKFGDIPLTGFGDSGSAARFFYCAKPDPEERAGNIHPTVKPLALMRWLVRLVSKPDDVILDPFAGSGTTPVAALLENRRCQAIEHDESYYATALSRLQHAAGRSPGQLFAVLGDEST